MRPFKKRKEKLLLYVPVLYKTWHYMVSHCSHALDIKEIYLLKTPIAFHVIVVVIAMVA